MTKTPKTKQQLATAIVATYKACGVSPNSLINALTSTRTKAELQAMYTDLYQFTNKYGEAVVLHGPVCGECSQRIGRHVTEIHTRQVNGMSFIVCKHCEVK